MKYVVILILAVVFISCKNEKEEILEQQAEIKMQMDSVQRRMSAVVNIQRQYTINAQTLERIDAEISKSLSATERMERYARTAERINAASDSARMLEPKKDSIRHELALLKWRYDSLDRELKKRN